MKKIFKFLGLAALAAAVLTGCSDLNTASDSGSSSSASSSGAYIKIVDGSAALKTIVPDYDTTFSNFNSFKLYCAPTPTDGSTITWDDSNLLKTVSSSSDLTGSTYSVPEGNVTFHLEATHTSQSVYTATTATKIGNGSNTVAFTLCPKEYKIGTGFYGNVDITLSFPSKVKAVDAKLYTYDISDTSHAIFTTETEYNSAVASKTYIASANATNKIASNSLTYSVQSVQSGIYIAQFKLYADYSTTTNGVTGTGKNPLTTYNEVVVVSSQGTSKATRTLTDADLAVPVYTVTYKNIDSSDTTIPANLTYDNVYLRGANSIQVPSVVTGTTGIRKTLDTDNVYTFAGWYMDEALTTPASLYSNTDCTIVANDLAGNIYYPVTSGDVTLYGKWTIDIGNAKKQCTNVPYNNFSVGDIILKDNAGTYYQLANKYAQFVTKAELAGWCRTNNYTGQAVVFYVPQTTNSDGTTSANPNASVLGQTRVLAVNIDNSTSDGADGTKFQWATSSAAGYTKALTSLGVARNDMVTLEGNTVYEYPTGTEYGSWKDGSTTYQALFDGEASGGTAITKLATIDDTSIQTALSALSTPVTPTTAKYSDYVAVLGNYPAFKYVMEEYNVEKDDNGNIVSDPVYSTKAGTAGSGSWYLPSVVQLLELYKNKDVVNAVIAKMDGDKLEKRFWSCSQVVKYGKDAWSVDFAATNVADAAQYDGDTSAGHGKSAHFFVCAISNIK